MARNISLWIPSPESGTSSVGEHPLVKVDTEAVYVLHSLQVMSEFWTKKSCTSISSINVKPATARGTYKGGYKNLYLEIN